MDRMKDSGSFDAGSTPAERTKLYINFIMKYQIFIIGLICINLFE